MNELELNDILTFLSTKFPSAPLRGVVCMYGIYFVYSAGTFLEIWLVESSCKGVPGLIPRHISLIATPISLDGKITAVLELLNFIKPHHAIWRKIFRTS